MANRRSILLGLLLIGLVIVNVWVWYTGFHSPASTLIMVGERITGDNLDIKSSR